MFWEEEIIEKIREVAEKIAERLNLEIFDISIKRQRKKTIVEIIIDKEDGYISIGDCERFSKEIDPWFESVDLIEGSYNLVVSSPGLDRPLRNEKDYRRFKGNLAKFVLKEAIENRNVIIGNILEVKDKELEVKDRDSGRIFSIDFSNIKKANLEIEI